MNTTEPQSLQEVARAILEADGGRSGREIGRLAKAKGYKLVATTINHLAAGTYNSRPSEETLQALAALSGWPIDVVRNAAKLPMPLTPLRDDLPPEADLLEGPQRRVIIDAIRVFVEQNRQLAALRSELEEVGSHAGSAAKKVPAPSPAEQLGKDDYDLAAHEERHTIEDEQHGE